jgi:hypothetical protein
MKEKNNKKVFVVKGFLPELYKWSPDSPTYNKKKPKQLNIKPSFCNAIDGSQGEDWITTYVYNMTVINNKQARLAYVSCDYVS